MKRLHRYIMAGGLKKCIPLLLADMSIEGFSQAEIVSAVADTQPVTYTYTAAIALVVYDSLILLRREVNYIYRGSHSLIKWIYVLVRASGLLIFLINFFKSQAHNSFVKTDDEIRCWVRQWVAGFFFQIVYTAIIKTLLVLRLRALYRNKKEVTIVLCFTTIVELLSTTYAYIMTGLNMQQYVRSPAPVPGCPTQPTNQLHHFRAPTVVWGTRLMSNSLELVFLFIGLYHSLKETDHSFYRGWKRLKQLAPTLYVFYRDGTIFYIPIFALSLFGFISAFTTISERITCANWEAWLAVVYYVSGTRLILNIRSTKFKFTTSMMTQQMSTLAFDSAGSDSEDSSIDTPETGSTVVLDISQEKTYSVTA
ncbi:hypothetical protein P691DRAFT_772798 [Macrolepiota fuliginosa MF-IS2]|uniref:DUF6533 domain-containing protein n=1 Tax=Macrolepiota fuliginosa MF-IS2 TaxID=1400762 RepID=A0A9P5XJ61_9AGAR|nr:hypothetical protein P691DRAFT_772798 [Macrolepiota fuliginosa MF-IS2]